MSNIITSIIYLDIFKENDSPSGKENESSCFRYFNFPHILSLLYSSWIHPRLQKLQKCSMYH